MICYHGCPAIAGVTIDSIELTARFKHDWQKTIIHFLPIIITDTLQLLSIGQEWSF